MTTDTPLTGGSAPTVANSDDENKRSVTSPDVEKGLKDNVSNNSVSGGGVCPSSSSMNISSSMDVSDEKSCHESPPPLPRCGGSSSSAAVVVVGYKLPYCGYFMGAKYIALIALVVQTVGAVLTLRVSRTMGDGDGEGRYISTTAVVMSEIIKLLCSVLLIWYESQKSWRTTYRKLETCVWREPGQTLKVGIPAFLYVAQNNLLFIALSNMSGALYQVTYQMKILTTALLSVIMLRKQLGLDKWMSLLLLTLGVALIQQNNDQAATESSDDHQSTLIGLIAVCLACLTSGFAGVYLELVLKRSNNVSIWVRNFQLSLVSIVLAFAGSIFNDYRRIADEGFFVGYNYVVIIAILLQSAGGLIVAAVLKYADNILKCFGNASAIVISCVLSYLIGDFVFSWNFFSGASLVIFATYAYSTPCLTDFTQFLQKTYLTYTSLPQ